MADTQLAVRDMSAGQTLSMGDQMAFARQAAESSIIPNDYRNKPANILIAVGFGQSMGLTPAESLYRINVIQGKPTASAELIAAQVRKAGHKLRLEKDEAHKSVTCTIVRADDQQYPISVTRDAEWAKAMGLSSKDNYRKQAMTMLTWRAITACAREACPEALYGVAYTPDEMTDMDTDKAPDVPVTPVETPKDKPAKTTMPRSKKPEPKVETKPEPEVETLEPDQVDTPESEATDAPRELTDMERGFFHEAAAQLGEVKGIDANAAAREIIGKFGDPRTQPFGKLSMAVAKYIEEEKHAQG